MMDWPQLLAIATLIETLRKSANPYLWVHLYAKKSRAAKVCSANGSAMFVIRGGSSTQLLPFEWAWATASAGSAAAEAKTQRSVDRTLKTLGDSAPVLQVCLEYLKAPEAFAVVATALSAGASGGGTRRDAFAADTQRNTHVRSFGIPALASYEVDEWLYPTLADGLSAAQADVAGVFG